MSALQAFSTDFSLMWEGKEVKRFDVTIGRAPTMPSRHALNYSWGEHCKHKVPKLMVPFPIAGHIIILPYRLDDNSGSGHFRVDPALLR